MCTEGHILVKKKAPHSVSAGQVIPSRVGIWLNILETNTNITSVLSYEILLPLLLHSKCDNLNLTVMRFTGKQP